MSKLFHVQRADHSGLLVTGGLAVELVVPGLGVDGHSRRAAWLESIPSMFSKAETVSVGRRSAKVAAWPQEGDGLIC